MTVPSLRETTDSEKQLISQLREKFLIEANKQIELYYSEDIEKIKNNDWSVHRFLLSSKGDVDDGLNRIINAMKWRKKFGVRDLKETDFPENYYKMLLFSKARDGSQLLLTKSKYHLPIDEWKELFKKFIIFTLEMLDNKNDGKGVTVLIDNSGSGFSNVDFDLAIFLRPIHGKYFPQLIELHILTEVPFIIRNILWILLSLLPSKTRKSHKIINKEELIDYVAEDQLPVSLGGDGTGLNLWMPKDAPNAEQIAERLGISKKNLDKFVAHFESLS